MRKSLISALLMGVAALRMSDADAAAVSPEAAALVDAPATATATIEVPAVHVSLFERVVALLKKDEQAIVDNIHAGVSALEAMFKSDEPEQTIEQAATVADPADPADSENKLG